jgi:hypothetical protein
VVVVGWLTGDELDNTALLILVVVEAVERVPLYDEDKLFLPYIVSGNN